MLDLDRINTKGTPLFDWEGALPQESIESYHERSEYLSSTDLKHVGRSLAHFKAYVIDRAIRKESRDLDFGDYAHRINILGDHDSFVVCPDFKPIEEKYILTRGPNKGKEGSKVVRTIREQYEEFQAENEGKTVLTTKEYDALYFMHDVFMKNTDVKELTEGCQKEQGFVYWDDLHKVKCKFRADYINKEKRIIPDYKTSVGASPYEAIKSIARYQYHLSAAHYVTGAERLFGGEWRFPFIFQEKTLPFAIGLYEMRKSSMDRARAQRSKYLMKINEGYQANHWPDYSGCGIRKVEVPEYALSED